MPETIIKEVELQQVTGDINLTLGADGKNVDIPRDSQGKIIIDSTTPTSTESVNVSLKNIEQNIADDENIYGAKNLIPIGQSSSMFIVNGDGTILINGTASSTGSSYTITFPEVMNDAYKFTIDYNGTWNSNVVVQLLAANNVVKAQFDQTTGGMQEINISANSSIIYFKIDVIPSGSVFNMTIKPMLRLASIKDRTYVPYAMTNKELTNKINNLHTKFSELDDVNIDSNTLRDGQVPRYDSSSQKWINGAAEDNKVLQNPSSTNADYEILFSETADNSPHTESAQKNNNLKFNPSTGNLQVTKINGIDIGSTPQFTDNKVEQDFAAEDDYNYNKNYRVLLSYSDNNENENNIARKTDGLKYNPYYQSLAEGKNTVAAGRYSHAEGDKARAIGSTSHAEGDRTTANYNGAHSEGSQTMADDFYSHAEGAYTRAYGEDSHAEGYETRTGDPQNRHSTMGLAAHAEGWYTRAVAQKSHAEGAGTCTLGDSSHAEGYSSTYEAATFNKPGIFTFGQGSHAEGYANRSNFYETGMIQAIGDGSHAEGYVTTADITQAVGKGSHAEGTGTSAFGIGAHAEGYKTQAGILGSEYVKTEDFGIKCTLPYTFSSFTEKGSAVIYNNEIHIIGGAAEQGTLKNQRHHYVWNGLIWIKLEDIPEEFILQEASSKCVSYNNEIHLFNGDYHYKWDGDTWSNIPWRGNHVYIKPDSSIIVFNNSIHILGADNTSIMHVKIDGDLCTSVATLPSVFQNGAAFVYQNAMHYIKGTDHYKFNGTQWYLIEQIYPTVGVNHGTVAVVNEENSEVVYLFSGTSTTYYSKLKGTTWTYYDGRGSIPENLWNCEAVTLNNEIYLLGNANLTGKSFYRWINNSVWVKNLPYKFTEGCIVNYNNEIHILGGYDSNVHYKWNGTSWEYIGTLPYILFRGSAVVYNNQIHILGGADNTTKHYVWNSGSSWTELTNTPFSIFRPILVYHDEIHAFDTSNNIHYKWNGNQWKIVDENSLITNIGIDSVAVIHDDEIHILGSLVYDSSLGYTVTKGHLKWDGASWKQLDDLPYTLEGGSAVAYNNEIHIFNTQYFKHCKWNGITWKEVSTISNDIGYGAAIVKDKTINILGGISGYSLYFNDITYGDYSHAEGISSKTTVNYSFALGKNGATDDNISDNSTLFAIGGDKDNLPNTEEHKYADSSENNIFSVDNYGNFFSTGAQSLMHGTLIGGTGTTTSGGSDIVKIPLEDGAVYFLHANGVNKNTNAKFGIGSYLIGATGISATTSAAAVGTSGAIGTGGTNPLRIFNLATTTTDSTGHYHSILGIGTSTSVIKLRWNLVKVLGSLNDFGWDE